MRRIVLIVPELVGEPGHESPLRENLPALRTLAERGEIRKLASMPRLETPEALYLGAHPGEVALRPGPLMVSSLGADPPERSIHFHLSLMSFDDGVAWDPGVLPPAAELDQLFALAQRLDTRTLTLLKGEGRDNGLVLEGRGDLGTTPAADLVGQAVRSHRPEGDHEGALRRLIDDSVNLLSELELNRRRVEEGFAPLNLLWPWGHGMRTGVPNLALRRGERAVIESPSFRLAGLARLAGDYHHNRSVFGQGLQTRLRAIGERALGRDLTIAVIEAPAELRAQGEAREEELHWFVRELDRELLQPLLDSGLDHPLRLALLAPSASREGLALLAEPPADRSGRYPFDERTLEERTVSKIDLDLAVREAVAL